MNKLNCVIIDDEIAGRIVLKELLNLYFENVTVVGEGSNIQEGFDAKLYIDYHVGGGIL